MEKGVQPEKQLTVQARKELPPPPRIERLEKIITQPIDENDKKNIDSWCRYYRTITDSNVQAFVSEHQVNIKLQMLQCSSNESGIPDITGIWAQVYRVYVSEVRIAVGGRPLLLQAYLQKIDPMKDNVRRYKTDF